MSIKTKTLALHSIQKNMLGTQQSENVLNVLLNSGKTLKITASNAQEARRIDNALHFYPSEGNENNSKDYTDFFELEVV
jgi:hypothetical protein